MKKPIITKDKKLFMRNQKQIEADKKREEEAEKQLQRSKVVAEYQSQLKRDTNLVNVKSGIIKELIGQGITDSKELIEETKPLIDYIFKYEEGEIAETRPMPV